MRILYYNWVQFDDAENRGGGVTVYQRNVIKSLIKDDANEIFFLSSGIAYNLFKKRLYLEKTKNIFGKKVKSYQIVNSPIMSPGQNVFKQINEYLTDESLFILIKKFIEENGPFDVIHFNNFEGLSLKVFELKKYFAKTKFVYSIHNYYSFCPQVNLWHEEKENCKNYCKGVACHKCLTFEPNIKGAYYAHCLAYFLKKHGIEPQSAIWNWCYSHADLISAVAKRLGIGKERNNTKSSDNNIVWNSFENKDVFKRFRELNVEYINKNIDVVLAVSDRVGEIVKEMGVEEKKVFTDYIGTEFAEKVEAPHTISTDDEICILYMGYARRDKGFFFLVDALKSLDYETAGKIRLFFATKDIPIEELDLLKLRYKEISWKNGYKHSELKKLLSDIDLGIVPVLWEDNLPQVAIEMVANGVPILCSTGGGANELSKSERFKFEIGNKIDFKKRLEYIVNNKEILAEYWEKAMPLVTMDKHIKCLMEYYKC